MSRNKTIELFKAMTGRSYKECRAILKANNWSYDKAFSYYISNEVINLNNLTKACDDAVVNFTQTIQREVIPAISNFSAALYEALLNVNRDQFIKTFVTPTLIETAEILNKEEVRDD